MVTQLVANVVASGTKTKLSEKRVRTCIRRGPKLERETSSEPEKRIEGEKVLPDNISCCC